MYAACLRSEETLQLTLPIPKHDFMFITSPHPSLVIIIIINDANVALCG